MFSPPGSHVVDNQTGLGEGTGLETHGGHGLDEVGCGQVVGCILRVVDSFDFLEVGRDGDGWFEDGVGC